MAETTFFTVGDARYFPGIIGLVNSLRRVGHHEEIVVLDGGFTATQQKALAATCTVVEFPVVERDAANPTYYKLVAPRMRKYAEGDVIVVIDSDIIVTSRLDELIERAAAGQLTAFPDAEQESRRFTEWQDIFDLSSPLRHETYFSAGLLVFSPTQLPDLIPKWWERCQSISSHPTIAEGAVGPTSQADQDALNATMMSEYPAGTVFCQDVDRFPSATDLQRLRDRVKIIDRGGLGCTFEGKRSIALHSSGHPKPWLTSRGIRGNAYVVLLTDMLNCPGLAVTVPKDEVPFWLRRDAKSQFALYSSWLRTLTEQVLALVSNRVRN